MVLLRFSDGNWQEIAKENKVEGDLYLDGKLRLKLDKAKRQIENDFDVGGLVVGEEGSGKSTMASNMMLYMTNNQFDPRKHIIKSHEDAMKVLRDVPDGSGIMFDEGYLLFYSGDALTKNQKAITKIFSIIRQKNLFFLIVAPSFFRLSSYFALDRTKFLVRVYNIKEKRGYFHYMGQKKKFKLYKKGKAKHDYRVEPPLFAGRFSECLLLDKMYKKIKRDTLEDAFKEVEDNKKKKSVWELERELKIKILKNNNDLPTQMLAKVLGYSERHIRNLKKVNFPTIEQKYVEIPIK